MCTVAVDCLFGAYAPKRFAQLYPELLSDMDRRVLAAGPEHECYWDTWHAVSQDLGLETGPSLDVLFPCGEESCTGVQDDGI